MRVISSGVTASELQEQTQARCLVSGKTQLRDPAQGHGNEGFHFSRSPRDKRIHLKPSHHNWPWCPGQEGQSLASTPLLFWGQIARMGPQPSQLLASTPSPPGALQVRGPSSRFPLRSRQSLRPQGRGGQTRVWEWAEERGQGPSCSPVSPHLKMGM